MDKTLARKWVDALRSGEYRQGKGGLRCVEDNSYCCLGVLLDVAAKEGIIEGKWEDDNDVSASYSAFVHANGELDVFTVDESLLTHHQQNPPIALNDNDGSSFEEIADYIEKEYLS